MAGSAIVRRLPELRDRRPRTNRPARQAEAEDGWRRSPPGCSWRRRRSAGSGHNPPAEFIYDNLAIQTNVIQPHPPAWKAAVPGLVLHLSAARAAADHRGVPPHRAARATNEWYAIAKIAGIKLCQAYRRQYGAISSPRCRPTSTRCGRRGLGRTSGTSGTSPTGPTPRRPDSGALRLTRITFRVHALPVPGVAARIVVRAPPSCGLRATRRRRPPRRRQVAVDPVPIHSPRLLERLRPRAPVARPVPFTVGNPTRTGALARAHGHGEVHDVQVVAHARASRVR